MISDHEPGSADHDLTPDEDELITLVSKLSDRIRAGEPVDLDAAQREHPRHAAWLAETVQAIRLLSALGRPAVGESAPGDAGACSGRRIGDYELVREVGRGGMGVVYEARQVSLGRKVALKVLPAVAALDLKRRRRFDREARAAALLRHDHIVPVYSVEARGESPYYVMQFVEGHNLADLLHAMRWMHVDGSLRAAGPDAPPEGVLAQARLLLAGRPGLVAGERTLVMEELAAVLPAANLHETAEDLDSAAGGPGEGPPSAADAASRRSELPWATAPGRYGRAYVREVALLGRQAAHALAHAHDNEVVHRDIKPSNLLLDRDGRLWVADFGLARLQNDRSASQAGGMAGTLPYMSPEQVSPDSPAIDHRTDIYSLGATLYELLTWRRPFSDSAAASLLCRIAQDQPVPIRRLNRSVPRDLETIVGTAMARDPTERFSTAAAMAEELQRFLDDRPLRIRPPSPWARLSKWSLRHRASVAAWSATVVLLLVAMVAALAMKNRELAEMARSEHRQKTLAADNLRAIRDLSRDIRLAAQSLSDAIPPGSSRTDEFYEGILKAYQKVVTQTPDLAIDPDLRHGLAQAHFQYARALANQDGVANAGRVVEHFDQAVGLLEPLSREHPDRVWARYDLFRTLTCRAHTLSGQVRPMRPDLALRDETRSLQVIEDLARDFPDNPSWRDAVANQNINLGSMLIVLKRLDEARRHFERAQELATRLAAEYPDRPTFARNSVLALDALAGMAGRSARPETAVPLLRRAIEGGAALVRAVPDDRAYPIEQSCRQAALADRLIELGQLGAAEPLLAEVVRTAERCMARFPEYDDYRIALFWDSARLAEIEHRLGKVAEAEALYRTLFERLERRCRERPDDLSVRNLLGSLLVACPVAGLRDPARTLALLEPSAAQDGTALWIALARFRLGKPRKAIALAKTHVGDRSGDDFCFILALAHARLDEPGEAAKWFREGVRLRDRSGPQRNADPLMTEAAAAVGADIDRPSAAAKRPAG